MAPEGGGHRGHILVAPAGQAQGDHPALADLLGQFFQLGDGVGALQGGDDALDLGSQLEGGQGLVVGAGAVLGAADVVQPGVLGPDAGIVEALAAFELAAEVEGIIPALESAHAIAKLEELAKEIGKGGVIALCLSGRGDKDVPTVAAALGRNI